MCHAFKPASWVCNGVFMLHSLAGTLVEGRCLLLPTQLACQSVTLFALDSAFVKQRIEGFYLYDGITGSLMTFAFATCLHADVKCRCTML